DANLIRLRAKCRRCLRARGHGDVGIRPKPGRTLLVDNSHDYFHENDGLRLSPRPVAHSPGGSTFWRAANTSLVGHFGALGRPTVSKSFDVTLAALNAPSPVVVAISFLLPLMSRPALAANMRERERPRMGPENSRRDVQRLWRSPNVRPPLRAHCRGNTR